MTTMILENNNPFGFWRNCGNCKFHVTKGILAACDSPCLKHPLCNKNRDGNCPSFERIWWYIWVAK